MVGERSGGTGASEEGRLRDGGKVGGMEAKLMQQRSEGCRDERRIESM